MQMLQSRYILPLHGDTYIVVLICTLAGVYVTEQVFEFIFVYLFWIDLVLQYLHVF